MNKVLEIIPMLRFVPVQRLNPNILIPKESFVQQTIGKPRAIQGAKKALLPRRIIKNFNRTPAEDVYTATTQPVQTVAAAKKTKRGGHQHFDKRALDSYFDNYVEDMPQAQTSRQESEKWIKSVVEELEMKDAAKKAEQQRILNSYEEAAQLDYMNFCRRLYY